MIQRIQSLFLLSVVVLTALLFVFPIAEYFSDSVSIRLTMLGVKSYVPSAAGIQTAVISSYLVYFLVFLNITIGAVAGYTIMQFKQRSFQIRLTKVALMLDIVLIIVLFVITDFLKKKLAVDPDYGIGIIFPVVSLIFLLLAQRFIQKDDKLVKSADRLR
jgi:hypothetical protein